jgi:hypothetical protein
VACRCRQRSARGDLDEPPAAALLTTAGNPVCTAAGRAVLAAIASEGLVDNAAKVGAALQDALRALAGSPGADRIGEVRGRGLAIGLELVDPQTGDRDPRLAAQVVYRAWELGAVVFYVGGNVLEITPPLVLTEDEAARAAAIIGDAIADAAAGRSTPMRSPVMPAGDVGDVFDGVADRVPAALADHLRGIQLIDHHVHGAFNKPVDRAAFEASINEGSTDPVPDFMTMFDSPLGLAIRRWCAPVLGLQAHASADDYWARRSELGPDELTTAMVTQAGVARWVVDTGFKGDLLTTPEQLAELSGRPRRRSCAWSGSPRTYSRRAPIPTISLPRSGRRCRMRRTHPTSSAPRPSPPTARISTSTGRARPTWPSSSRPARWRRRAGICESTARF